LCVITLLIGHFMFPNKKWQLDGKIRAAISLLSFFAEA